MAQTTRKTALLNDIDNAYTRFKALLAPLSEEQLTTSGVNGTWSVKDNIAHLSAWHKVLLARLLAAGNFIHYQEDVTEGMDTESLNERFYQQNKARPLSDVVAEFDATYQRIIQALEDLTEEQLSKPQVWLEGRAAWEVIPGDTIEHYQEHAQIIQAWSNKETHI